MLLAVRQVQTEDGLALIDEHFLHADADAPATAVRDAEASALHEARAALRIEARRAHTTPAEARRNERRERHVTTLQHERKGHASAERHEAELLRIRPAEITTSTHGEEVGVLAF